MNQLMIDVWPYLLSGVLAVIAGWMASLMRGNHKIFEKQAVLEERMTKEEKEIERLDKRIDHKGEQFEKIQKEVEGVRTDLAEIKGDIKSLTTELQTSMEFLKGNREK
ncbi:MAG: hypothetical protein ACOCNX_01050 [Prevotella sp.]